MIPIIAIAFAAAVVNGALGYGFSSVAVPLALLLVGNRELNPAIVLLEVVMNVYVLYTNRDGVQGTWRRAAWVVVGLPAGIVVGTSVLTRVDPSWLKLATFLGLLPLILLQAAGYRRAIRAERTAGAVLGGGVGVLYAVTTISGPPLAMFLTNQGYAKQEFRAALGLIRLVASVLTAAFYAQSRLFTEASLSLLVTILPSILVGIPVGAWLIRRVQEESFRRVCMAFDAAIVAFGASTLLRSLHVVNSSGTYALFAGVLLFDAIVLYRYFRTASSAGAALHTQLQTP